VVADLDGDRLVLLLEVQGVAACSRPHVEQWTLEVRRQPPAILAAGGELRKVEPFDGVFERLHAVALDERLVLFAAVKVPECTAERVGHG
jgi:hypothetical protein